MYVSIDKMKDDADFDDADDNDDDKNYDDDDVGDDWAAVVNVAVIP